MSHASPSRESSPRVPSYRRHKPTGQAVVTLSGRDIYLGPWNSERSRVEYDRLIGEWLSAGRCLPHSQSDLTVGEMALAYRRFAERYYLKNGSPSPFLSTVRLALKHLWRVYGHTLVREFGPLKLQAMQERFVQADHSREYVNKLSAVIRRAFKWAVSQEMVPPTIHQALSTVPGLRKGRTPAREPEPVAPVVPDAVTEATLPFLPPVVADMVKVQRFTGCRPGEVCAMRPCDVERSGEVWTYRPASHKTQHHGRQRIILIGPKAQVILRPYLLRDATSYCFSPGESEAKRKTEMRARRRTKVQPSQVDRRKRQPKREPSDRYVKDAYNRAIRRAVNRANKQRAKDAADRGESEYEHVPAWSPNQLRHSAATEIRRQFGLEAAQTVLGHAKADITQVYAERDLTLAAEVMRKIG